MEVAVSQVSAAAAAAAMRAAGVRAPLPCDTPEGIAAHGECFEIATDTGRGVFVLRRKGEVLWIDGAAATQGEGLTAPGFALVRSVARQVGCTRVAFETSRRGLVRRAQRFGARIAGVVMEFPA